MPPLLSFLTRDSASPASLREMRCALLIAACIAATQGRRAGNTLLPWRDEPPKGKEARLVQFTDPPPEAERAAAEDKAAEEEAAEADLHSEVADESPEKLSTDKAFVRTPECMLSPHKCHKWSLDELRKLFQKGQPSNSLSLVGLTVHGFDGTLHGGDHAEMNDTNSAATAYHKSEKKMQSRAMPWSPCNAGWCKNAAKWMSTSIINKEHPDGFSDGGFILSPSANKVMCSHYFDFGSMDSGCETEVSRDGPPPTNKPFARDQLKDMMERSMVWKPCKGIYNEVLINGTEYEQNLPHSIAAFYYGLLNDQDTWSKLHTTHMYVWFLKSYNLTTEQVPLIQFDLDRPNKMTDMSKGSFNYVKKNPYHEARRQWQKAHPDLFENPEQIQDRLRAQAQERRKMLKHGGSWELSAEGDSKKPAFGLGFVSSLPKGDQTPEPKAKADQTPAPNPMVDQKLMAKMKAHKEKRAKEEERKAAKAKGAKEEESLAKEARAANKAKAAQAKTVKADQPKAKKADLPKAKADQPKAKRPDLPKARAVLGAVRSEPEDVGPRSALAISLKKISSAAKAAEKQKRELDNR